MLSGSVFNTYSGLYLSKDNDLLLSMPIPVSTIMAARLLAVYLMGLMYSSVATLPAAIVDRCVVPQTVSSVVGSLLLVALVSLIVLFLSCALGWAVAPNQPEAEVQELRHGARLPPLHRECIISFASKRRR